MLLGVLPNANQQPAGDADPTRAILAILAVTIGLPYFVLSATGPLLQAWFAHSFPGRTPYRLYALSNVGSLLALVSYPFLFEGLFDLPWQGRLWSVGFIAFGLLCGLAAWRIWSMERAGASPPPSLHGVTPSTADPSPETDNPTPILVVDPQPGPQSPAHRPSPLTYLLWLLLPAFASVTLMATTNHVSTDVAVVPLLWVAPLAPLLAHVHHRFRSPGLVSPHTRRGGQLNCDLRYRFNCQGKHRPGSALQLWFHWLLLGGVCREFSSGRVQR